MPVASCELDGHRVPASTLGMLAILASLACNGPDRGADPTTPQADSPAADDDDGTETPRATPSAPRSTIGTA